MGQIAIRVEGLGKKFRIGAPERYRTLRDTLTDTLTAPVHWLRRARNGGAPAETFWALKDVSFEVKHGEVIGIIGRNGAGKSTLLKILSRITEPTEGHAEIHGRVVSLLEVGTGFHAELSGRENIFLNGAILGMKRAEIQRKFDEIVAFAEVEKFIDTPVKHYSSGMYMRLAFAVAAHLEPEILIVDEVLAVGDQRFQEKCLNKMGDVSKQGRTILFVSHSMSSIQRLCERVLVLEAGRVRMDARTAEAVSEYLLSGRGSAYESVGAGLTPSISRAQVEERENCMLLSAEFQSPFPLCPPVLGFVIYDAVGNPVFGTNTRLEPPPVPFPPACSGRFEVSIPTGHFRPNRYLISLWLADAYTDYCEHSKVLQAEVSGLQLDAPPHVVGSVRIPLTWRFQSGLLEMEGSASPADGRSPSPEYVE
jgi:lipopolysaccharide transport system ATP-binding protein